MKNSEETMIRLVDASARKPRRQDFFWRVDWEIWRETDGENFSRSRKQKKVDVAAKWKLPLFRAMEMASASASPSIPGGPRL
jgi:hypothetical protein